MSALSIVLLATTLAAQQVPPEAGADAQRAERPAVRPVRVLLLDEQPRWEFRYLKNVLLRDRGFETQVFLCSAPPTVEQDHSEQLPALRELPRTANDLATYDVILIGDVPPTRLGASPPERDEWLARLSKFVAQGGGVGFVWGRNAMPEAYRGTALEQLLPVELNEEPPAVTSEGVRIQMIPERSGAGSHPIVELDPDRAKNAKVWHETLAPIRSLYPVLRARDGCEVILANARTANRYGRQPVVVVSTGAKSRRLFIGTDETWRWRNRYGEKYYGRFWTNVVRWLAGEGRPSGGPGTSAEPIKPQRRQPVRKSQDRAPATGRSTPRSPTGSRRSRHPSNHQPDA